MVDIDKTVDLLRRTPLFQGLKKRQLERLAAEFVERKYKEGEIIVTQGKGGEGFFIIKEGMAEAIHMRADGTRMVLNPLQEGDFFGELALLTDTMRTASVVASEDTCCLALTRWNFLALLKDEADMAVTVLQELASRFSSNRVCCVG